MESEKYLRVERIELGANRSYIALLRRLNPEYENKSSVAFWVRILMGVISKGVGLYQGIYRASQMIAKLDPPPEKEENITKTFEGIFLTSNLLEAHIVRRILAVVNPPYFHYGTIISCLISANYTPLLKPNVSSRETKLLEPFLLQLLYIKLLLSNPNESSEIYDVLFKVKQRSDGILGWGTNKKDIINSIMERKLRFRLIPQYVPTEGSDYIASYRDSTIFFNEFFECCQLDYLIKGKLVKQANRRNKEISEEEIEKQKKTKNFPNKR